MIATIALLVAHGAGAHAAVAVAANRCGAIGSGLVILAPSEAEYEVTGAWAVTG